MPIYEYRCAKCGVFEQIQRITEKSVKRCPTCKGKVERIMSSTSFVLKGTGWYATDYPRGGKPDSSKPAETPAAAPTASESDGKSSSKADSSTISSTSSDKPAGTSKPATSEKSADAK
jgi:putative FmdB family regulatory protein